MNRRELVGHIGEELNRVFPDGTEEMDGEDLEVASDIVVKVVEDAQEAFQEASDEEEEEEEGDVTA